MIAASDFGPGAIRDESYVEKRGQSLRKKKEQEEKRERKPNLPV